MLKIRLSRTGKRNDPSFRVVVTEHTAPVKAGYIEHIGYYNPKTKKLAIEEDRLKLWTNKGAKLSDTMTNLLVREKKLPKDRLIKITRKPKKKEEKEKGKEEKKEKEQPKKELKKDKKEKKEDKDNKEKSKKVEKK